MNAIKTETHTLVFGHGESKVKVHLTVGTKFVYLSADTIDADINFYLHPLVDMAQLAISSGANHSKVLDVFKYHQNGDEPQKTNSKYVPMARSVPDMIGRYLENRYIKCPIIKRMLANGIDPARALDKTGRRYIDWSVDELRKLEDETCWNEK